MSRMCKNERAAHVAGVLAIQAGAGGKNHDLVAAGAAAVRAAKELGEAHRIYRLAIDADWSKEDTEAARERRRIADERALDAAINCEAARAPVDNSETCR